jgi:hypothetical protein
MAIKFQNLPQPNMPDAVAIQDHQGRVSGSKAADGSWYLTDLRIIRHEEDGQDHLGNAITLAMIR